MHSCTTVLALLAIVAAAGCRQDNHGATDPVPAAAAVPHTGEVTLTAEAIARYGVVIATAQTVVLRPTLVAPARASLDTEAIAHVGSPLRGRAIDIRVRRGDQVAQGDTLCVIESPELGEAQAEFLQRRIAREAAAPAAELAKSLWDRARLLHEQSQGISLTEVQHREAGYLAAVAALRTAEAAALGAEHRLRLLGMDQAAIAALAAAAAITPQASIRAPIAGQVVEREVALGELVAPDGAALFLIADLAVLWVLAEVPEARLAEVRLGATAWVGAGASGSARYQGRIAFVAPIVDAATRTAQVRVELPAGQLPLWPGMFAELEIVTTPPGGEPAPTVAVPAAALQTIDGEPSVFVPVAGSAGAFKRRTLSVGKAAGGLLPVLSGLDDGEPFVAAGSFISKAELGKGAAAHDD